FETWIAPTFHQGSFHDLADEDVGDLACVLIRTLDALRRTCGDPDYNLVVYSAPTNGHEIVFHWHMKIIPRLSTQAGFEMGSAMSINTVPPEIAPAAARRRRTVRSLPRSARDSGSGGETFEPVVAARTGCHPSLRERPEAPLARSRASWIRSTVQGSTASSASATALRYSGPACWISARARSLGSMSSVNRNRKS